MKVRLAKNFVVIGFVSLIIFIFGSIMFKDLFSGYLPGIRGGLIFVLLIAAVLLIIMSFQQKSWQNYLPLIYLIAIIAGYFYQVILLYDAPLTASFPRCLFYILLIISMLFFIADKKISLNYYFLFWGWLCFNVFSIMGDNAPDNVMAIYSVGIILPAVFALTLAVYFKNNGDFNDLSRIIAIGALSLLSGMILIMVLATFFKFGDIALARNASDLNFGMGLLFLSWPFIIWEIYRRPILQKVFIILLIFSAVILSFSRTAMILATILFLLTFGKKINSRSTVFSLFLVSIIVYLSIPKAIIDHLPGRLNINQWSDLLNCQYYLHQVIGNERTVIWSSALKYFYDKPFIGNGLGSFSQLISEETNGEFAYSGAHNLFLTVAAERGAIGLFAAVWLALFIFYNLLKNWLTEVNSRKEFYRLAFISFVFFLIFACITGAEMLTAGTVRVDGLVSVFLMVYLVIVVSRPKIRATTGLQQKN